MTSDFTLSLSTAFDAGTPLVYCETNEDERLAAAVATAAQAKAASLLSWRATRGIEHLVGDGDASSFRRVANCETLDALLTWLVALTPEAAAREFGHPDVLVVALDAVSEESQRDHLPVTRRMKDLFEQWERVEPSLPRRTLVLSGVGWTPPPQLGGYLSSVHLPLPTRPEIEAILCERAAFRRVSAVAGDPGVHGRCAERAKGLPKLAIEHLLRRLDAAAASGAEVSEPAFLQLVDAAKRDEVARTQILEIQPPPRPGSLTMGGFRSFQDWFRARRPFFLAPDRSELCPRGVLLVGFPGCGKSYCARWIAQELQVPLVAMDLGRIQDRWVGSSEARMRVALRTLEAAAPVVLFIDEIEKAVAGFGTESSGVTTRLVGQLLTWLADRSVPVWVVATCNTPNLPPELTRAGRFDATFLVLPPSLEDRREVLDSVAGELQLEIGAVREQAAQMTDRYTGAELKQLLKEAAYRAGPTTRALAIAHIESGAAQVRPLARQPVGERLLAHYEEQSGLLRV